MPIFVQSPTEVIQGEEAARLLAEKNDLRFATADGVVSVDDARWQEAQRFERDMWIRVNPNRTELNEADNLAGFNGYAALPADLGNVLELGCGPFTVLRSILAAGHTANHATLVDPLADDFRTSHAHCTYKEGHVSGVPVTLFPLAAEDVELHQTFDTVILVNTLSHCRDAQAVLTLAFNALKPGGLVVFQEYASAYKPDEIWDAAHPLKVTQEYLDRFVARFDEVYRNGSYFIGRKPEGEYVEMEAPVEVVEAIKAGVPVGHSIAYTPDAVVEIVELPADSDLDDVVHTPAEIEELPEPKKRSKKAKK